MMFLQCLNTWFWGEAEGELIKVQRQGSHLPQGPQPGVLASQETTLGMLLFHKTKFGLGNLLNHSKGEVEGKNI